IDFAYSIHSASGNTMVGAKVNGRMVGFDYQLHNGDIVEINTSKAAHGPSRDWMTIAKSSEARSKIRQWFKRERKEENIAQGRASFEAELKHVGLSLNQVTAPDVLPNILKRVGFPSLDEMYAAIGYGGYTSLKAVNRVRDELLQISRAAALERAAREAAAKAAQESAKQPAALPRRVKSEKGIVVEGLSNCLVKFSKCCTPVPGDEIIGFITRGYGVSVHRKDCPNADPTRNAAEQGRWIKVSWGDDVYESYSTSLEVVCKDRNNLLMDISAALSTCKVGVSNLNVHTTADGFAIFHVTISVANAAQLDQVIRKIQQISAVMKVNRVAG
ncbi:MAG: TGS domain-containing protein, partial [Oscillospiraceae bacterium]|nr:TGS domain-containing protein [Oscillospiraceae bacterium]